MSGTIQSTISNVASSGGGGGFSGRAGQVTCSSGDASKAVTFSSDIGSSDYDVRASFINTIDASPQFQEVTVTAQSSAGFTATWNAGLDSSNYILSYSAIPKV